MNAENEYKCNICQVVLHTDKKSMDLLEHIKQTHEEVYTLHKENPEATVGFRIEFLHLNMLKDDDPKTQPVIIGEVCEAQTEEIATITEEKVEDSHLVVMPNVKKKSSRRDSGMYSNSLLLLFIFWMWQWDFWIVQSIKERNTSF